MGKFANALADVAKPRLDIEETATGIWSKIQVALNDVAKSITGVRRSDQVTVKDLLDLAGIESANRIVFREIAA
jgi:D-alanyl-D-alanine carboxypeptidase